jgi:hypothetical protein
MWTERLMRIGWPAFLAACALELIVFAVLDPAEIHWLGYLPGWRQAFYTVAFFVFWAIAVAACSLTALLELPCTAVKSRHGNVPLPRELGSAAGGPARLGDGRDSDGR